MKKKEFLIIVNGQPFVGIINESLVPGVVADVEERFGSDVKIEIFVHESYPYALTDD